MRYKWVESKRTKDLTVIVVARDLVRLCYPFVESLISTIPLGCKYLIGNFGNDSTKEIYQELGRYVPVEVIDLEWPPEPGWGAVAIGIATQRLIERSPTEYALNVQACEVYCPDAIESIFADHPWVPPGEIGPMEFRFRHFYGNMNHGGPAYGGYATCPRLYKRDSKFDNWDGWVPNGYCGGFPVGGWINRYGYCHLNTITQKLRNHAELYRDGDAEPKIAGTTNLGKTRTWFDSHPKCVEHLVPLENYDVQYSLDYAKQHLL